MLQATPNPLQFGLCCVIDSRIAGQSFIEFVFVRELFDVPIIRCDRVTGAGATTRLGIHPSTKSKYFSFAVLDRANDPNVRLTSLVIAHKATNGGPWLFETNSPISFAGSAIGTDNFHNPTINPVPYLLFRVLRTRLVDRLDDYLDDPDQILKFNVEATISIGGTSRTYFADPEIGVETGGDR